MIGAVAGYVGGLVDNILMRIVDVFFAIPFLFVILVAARFFGQGQLISLILIFGLLSWPLIARLVRAMFLSLREADFVEAARAVGVSDIRITFRHILPSALGPVIVAMTLIMASNIVLEAFVSFLGFGLTQDQTSWGNALSNAQTVLSARQLVVGVLPGHGHRPDRAGDQLRRRRSARRARSAVAAMTPAAGVPPPDDVLLEVRGLQTHFKVMDGTVPAVDGVDFSLRRGETLGLVGESGCGKSVTALSIMRLIETARA